MKNTDYLQAEGHRLVVVGGSWEQASDAALDPAKTKGVGFSVAITCAGTVTITYDEPYGDLITFIATETETTASALSGRVRPGTYVAPSGSTKATQVVEIVSSTGSAITWRPAGANNRVNFLAMFRDSSVKV